MFSIQTKVIARGINRLISLLLVKSVWITETQEGNRSIGCEPCTRPIEAHQHEREGRWWWENPEAKECGLHVAEEEA